MNKYIYILLVLVTIPCASLLGQMQKIYNPDPLRYSHFGQYVSISKDYSFIENSAPNGSQASYIYKKNGDKWSLNQLFNIDFEGILNNERLIEDKGPLLLIYKRKEDNLYYIQDSIRRILYGIRRFTINDDWIYIRSDDYLSTDFSKICIVDYFYHRENDKWILKNEFKDTIGLIVYGNPNMQVETLAMSSDFTIVGEYGQYIVDKNKVFGRLLVYKRNGNNWSLHQIIYEPNVIKNKSEIGYAVSISPNGKFMATCTELGKVYIYRLEDDKYYINKTFEDSYYFRWFFDLTNDEFLLAYIDEGKGIIRHYKYKSGTWVRKHDIHTLDSDTTCKAFGWSIDRDDETVITGAVKDDEYDRFSGAAYIFQIPARDTLRAEICQGQSYTFNDTVIYDEGHYTDTLLASYGVDSVVQLYLTVHPEARVEIDTVLCEKGDMLQVGDSILTEAGTYEIGLRDIFGCDSIVTVHLDYESLEVADSITADYGCENGKIDLILQNANNPPYAFSWSGGETMEDISGLSSGVYTVKITDKSGCIYEKEYTVDDSIAYLIPNAFFPSGQEELNKTFRIYQAKEVNILTTEIYDRWGEKIFNGGQNEYWDGTYQGKMQSPGVYLYRIVIDSPCGEEVKTGQVMLLR